ncbi:MAG: glycosyltransferase family 2 protein [Myxococcales bacterium]|nr:glycosyltransferase family 2 protein [Myxococcales bacterium]
MDAPERLLSVVVPFHNEDGNVVPLHERLSAVAATLGRPVEFVYVDDGSSDDTAGRLAQVADADDRVVVVTLRRNFGQTAALVAGFDLSVGETVITLDGDLQHAPEDIPALLAAIEAGADVASGWRRDRATIDPWLRTVPSRVANGLIRRVSGVQLRDFGTTFKAYRRDVIDDLELHGELHRFIPALAAARGARITEVPIQSLARHSGTSHYGIGRTWGVLVDLIVLKFLLSYVGRPLRAFAAVGLPLFAVGFLVALAVTIQFYFFTPQIGYGNLIFAALCMIVGVQFLGMGLVAELGARTYARTGKQRPYAVRRIRRRAG